MKNFYNKDFVYSILKDRYFTTGETEWEHVVQRVARYVAAGGIAKGASLDTIKRNEKEYYDVMLNREFLPNSPTLFNAGVQTDKDLLRMDRNDMRREDYQEIYDNRYENGCLSACFVEPIEDSMESIMQASKDMALITKAGGGVGFDFSKLRPKNSPITGGGVSTGPVGFMEIFNTTADVVRQGGRRRAALMGILDYDHPDALEFIEAKKDNDGESVLSYFNISLDVDAKQFLKAIREDVDINFKHPHSGITGSINAREYLQLIAENAWASGDPGLMFIDRFNENYAMANKIKVDACNPCGEQLLPEYSSCNLGSIDVTKMKDFAHYRKTIKTAVRFLDDVVDINTFPLQQNAEANSYYRNIGLGLMGIADYLINRGLRYNSREGRVAVAKLMADLTIYSYAESAHLAYRYGAAPAFAESRYVEDEEFIPIKLSDWPEMEQHNDLLIRLFKLLNDGGSSLRNITLNCIAPTGTISNIAETSSGIEPNFAFEYTRYMTNKHGERVPLTYKHRYVEDNKDVLARPEYIIASEVSPEDHLAMQDIAQRYLDGSISKTINLPNEASVEDITNIYLKALSGAVKGLTVYRDGSLSMQVLEKNEQNDTVKKRTEEMHGTTRVHESENGWETYVTVNYFDGNRPAEVFISGQGRTPEIIGRLSSLALRAGAPIEKVISQLSKVGGYAENIANTMQAIIDNRTGEDKWHKGKKGILINEAGDLKCPMCGEINTIHMGEGCMGCSACGFGMCS